MDKKRRTLLITVAAVLLVVAAFLLLRRSQPLGELKMCIRDRSGSEALKKSPLNVRAAIFPCSTVM